MTSELHPYQRELLGKITTVPIPTRVLIVAPAGVGVSAVLVRAAADAVALGGVVFVVVSRRALLEQWVDRLHDAGVESVTELRKATEAIVALDEAEGAAVASRGAIVATIQVLMHGAGRRAGGSLSPSLLIVERPSSINAVGTDPSKFDATVAELASRSERVIVVTPAPADVPWLEPTETFEVSLAEALELRPANAPFVLVTYTIASVEVDLYERAQRLADECGGILLVRVSTRPALHGMLTRLAARLSGETSARADDPDEESANEPAEATRPGLVDDVWELLDQLEALGDDSRLRVVVDMVRAALGDRRPVFVVTDRVDEAEYVAGRLRGQDFPVFAVSGSTEASERRRAIEQFGPGNVLVVTRMLQESLEQPPRTEEIWWSSPRTVADAVLRLTHAADGGRTVALVAEPPLPDDRRLLSVLDRLSRDAAFRPIGAGG